MFASVITTLKRRTPRRAPHLRPRPPQGYKPEPMPRIRWYS